MVSSITHRMNSENARYLEEIAAARVIGRWAILFRRDLRSPAEAVHDQPISKIAPGIPIQFGRSTALSPYSSFPIATAVSAMRFEKPHSLSYQDITRTSVPFCTLVWSMWNVEECGSWLKSIETFGAVV